MAKRSVDLEPQVQYNNYMNTAYRIVHTEKDSKMSKIYAKDLESAAKLVDMTYKHINPRVGDWLLEPGYISCDLRNGQHIYIQETLTGFMLWDNNLEYNAEVAE